MKYLQSIFILLLMSSLLVLTGCSDDDDDHVRITTELRVTHASPDAPAVNVYVDGELTLENVDYKQSSGIININTTSAEVEVRGILPDGSELSVIGPVTLDLFNNTRTDVVAYDNLLAGADVNIKAKVIESDLVVNNNDVLISVLHAAPQVADVDIYVTSPGAALVDPITAGFGDAAGPVELMADTDYQVRITAAGSNTVVYDSGTLSFAAGTELLLVAVENTTGIGDTKPVNLLAVGADGANEVFDTSIGAEVRVVHNSADTPAVDLLIDGAEVINALTFPNAADYDQVAAPAGTYSVVVAADADNSIAPIAIPELALEQGQSYTAVAIGGLNSITDETLEALLTVDDRRTVATAARVRVIHGSYAVAETIPVDVYLTPTAVITDADAAITNLAYGEATDQLPVAAGDYFITVTPTGDKTVFALQTAAAVTLDAARNYTIIARDPAAGEIIAPNLITATILAE